MDSISLRYLEPGCGGFVDAVPFSLTLTLEDDGFVELALIMGSLMSALQLLAGLSSDKNSGTVWLASNFLLFFTI